MKRLPAICIFLCSIADIHGQSVVISAPADSVFTITEIPAEFPGGASALMKYIQQNVSLTNYTINREENSVPAKLWASFIVSKNGDVENVIIKRSSGNVGIDSSLCSALRKMPSWAPAQIDGKPVRQQINFPINLCPIR